MHIVGKEWCLSGLVKTAPPLMVYLAIYRINGVVNGLMVWCIRYNIEQLTHFWISTCFGHGWLWHLHLYIYSFQLFSLKNTTWYCVRLWSRGTALKFHSKETVNQACLVTMYCHGDGDVDAANWRYKLRVRFWSELFIIVCTLWCCKCTCMQTERRRGTDMISNSKNVTWVCGAIVRGTLKIGRQRYRWGRRQAFQNSKYHFFGEKNGLSNVFLRGYKWCSVISDRMHVHRSIFWSPERPQRLRLTFKNSCLSILGGSTAILRSLKT